MKWVEIVYINKKMAMDIHVKKKKNVARALQIWADRRTQIARLTYFASFASSLSFFSMLFRTKSLATKTSSENWANNETPAGRHAKRGTSF